MEGVDYSYDHPDPRGLAMVGKSFACRYVGPGGAGKHLTPREAQALSDAGLSIVANAEGAGDGMLGGYGVGRDWARSAHEMAIQCGMPAHMPIYLSVDFDCTAGQWSRVRDALRGAASVIGEARVGVYGSYRVMQWAMRDRVASWYWQTFAWSNGQVQPGIHIFQYRNGVSLVGGTVDLNRSQRPDFGQWRVGQAGPHDNGGGGSTMEARDIIEYHIVSEGLGWDQPVREYLKAAEAGRREVVQLRREFAEFADGFGDGEPNGDLANLSAKLDNLLVKLDDVANAPLVDPVAVAAAIANRPEIAAAIANQVADRLAKIVGEITMSGSLNAQIKPE